MATDNNRLAELQQVLGYCFSDTNLLREALTHKSFANEKQLENCYGNERLEFLGDAVLQLAISHILMQCCRDCSEGDLSKMRAAIVNTEELSSLARTFNIGKYILLSRGEEENRGREKKSILTNVYESLVAAVYCDGGYTAVFTMIENHFAERIREVSEKGFLKDYKSRLQEYAQSRYNEIPTYIIITEEGPDHIKVFESQVFINDVPYEKGRGSNKKSAEQEAARRTLQKLLEEDT